MPADIGPSCGVDLHSVLQKICVHLSLLVHARDDILICTLKAFSRLHHDAEKTFAESLHGTLSTTLLSPLQRLRYDPRDSCYHLVHERSRCAQHSASQSLGPLPCCPIDVFHDVEFLPLQLPAVDQSSSLLRSQICAIRVHVLSKPRPTICGHGPGHKSIAITLGHHGFQWQMLVESIDSSTHSILCLEFNRHSLCCSDDVRVAKVLDPGNELFLVELYRWYGCRADTGPFHRPSPEGLVTKKRYHQGELARNQSGRHRSGAAVVHDCPDVLKEPVMRARPQHEHTLLDLLVLHLQLRPAALQQDPLSRFPNTLLEYLAKRLRVRQHAATKSDEDSAQSVGVALGLG
mmetsp:Transcript_45278/g.119514  ORF Transcript_45278/g.119514 Transcript_45278/m.119514 type:complete len:347 (-) Transcript_45278:1519-2559(-)